MHIARSAVWPVLALVAVLTVSCGPPDNRSHIVPPPYPGEDKIGLALAERILLVGPDGTEIELAPAVNSIARYRGRIEPGGNDAIFERSGASGVYLAWLPEWGLPRSAETVRVVLTSHEVIGPNGRRSNNIGETAMAPILVSRAPGKGQIAYIGAVVRRFVLAGADTEGPPSPAELGFDPDPEAKWIAAARNDNALLEERLVLP
jgi:hypothetical protein